MERVIVFPEEKKISNIDLNVTLVWSFWLIKF